MPLFFLKSTGSDWQLRLCRRDDTTHVHGLGITFLCHKYSRAARVFFFVFFLSIELASGKPSERKHCQLLLSGANQAPVYMGATNKGLGVAFYIVRVAGQDVYRRRALG